MDGSYLLQASILLYFIAKSCYGAVLFSSLPRTLLVSASPREGQVLKAGEDSITITLALNQSLEAETDQPYNRVKAVLCYAPISQIDRPWRKTVDNLSRDKTCQFTVAHGPYNRQNQSFRGSIERDVPSATYFIRVYALNSDGTEVGYGQTTEMTKRSNLFEVQGISGRHLSLDVASACFSAFALLSLFGFFLLEKRSLRVAAKV